MTVNVYKERFCMSIKDLSQNLWYRFLSNADYVCCEFTGTCIKLSFNGAIIGSISGNEFFYNPLIWLLLVKEEILSLPL